MADPKTRNPSPRNGEDDAAHDILAAEEFGVPTPDPALRDRRAHDILAAEEFGMPAMDPVLHHHGPVQLPEDPTGIAEPHDILAAEEFAFPAPRPGASAAAAARAADRRRLGFALALVVFVALWRKRHS